MLKKLGSRLVLSSLLLTSTTFAAQVAYDREHPYVDPATTRAAAFRHTVTRLGSDEAQWWGDYVDSGERDIAVYVDRVAAMNPKAAAWFLLTGGANGFTRDPATPEQSRRLLSAMGKVAAAFSSSGNARVGLETWARAAAANDAGHLHLQMLGRQIADLKRANAALSVEVAGLTQSKTDLTRQVGTLTAQVADFQKGNSALEARLVAVGQVSAQLREDNTKLQVRVGELEQFQKDTVPQLAGLQPVLDRQKADFEDRLERQRTDLTGQVTILTTQVGTLNTRIDTLQKRLEEVERERLTELRARLDELRTIMDTNRRESDARTDAFAGRFQALADTFTTQLTQTNARLDQAIQERTLAAEARREAEVQAAKTAKEKADLQVLLAQKDAELTRVNARLMVALAVDPIDSSSGGSSSSPSLSSLSSGSSGSSSTTSSGSSSSSGSTDAGRTGLVGLSTLVRDSGEVEVVK
jgi:mRNA-degrading endonuclease toxin of MazEF toxin-antitoxin module